jgi:Uma2 family endonuclease
MGELGFFDDCRVERIHGVIIEKYPRDLVDPSPRPFRFTREQYYRLGELGYFEGKRVELIHGEIVEMSPINRPHAISTGLVSDTLEKAFAVGYFVETQQPFAVPGVSPGSEPQPDVAVIPGARRDYPSHPDRAAILVEVADATLRFDTIAKAELYAGAGVADYWVLDIKARQLHVFRDSEPQPAGLGARAYKTRLVLSSTDSISPLAAPTASIRVADLLP